MPAKDGLVYINDRNNLNKNIIKITDRVNSILGGDLNIMLSKDEICCIVKKFK